MIQKPRLGMTVIAFFVCQLFFLAAVPIVSIAQINGFDTNGNGLIDDEELAVIINYWAQQKATPHSTKTVMLPGDVPLLLVKIPSGEIIVNSNKVHVDEFWIGKYEITQAQWEAVMGKEANLSTFKNPGKPVEMVSWDDCHDFLEKLNTLVLGDFSLPSEAQWVHACRAGTEQIFFWGASVTQASLYSWHMGNSDGETHAVGMRAPNPWGLYDMTGNVEEWCEDECPRKNTLRIILGGSWKIDAYYSSFGSLGGNNPANRSDCIGFRVVRTP